MSAVEHSSNITPPTNPEQGFSFNFCPDPSETVHAFCGPNEIGGAGCPNCSKPLLRLLSLSSTDTRLNVDPAITPALHLLYCWTCSIPYGVFSYRIRKEGTVELLDLPPTWESAFGPDGPYDGYTGTFKMKRVGLVPLSAEQVQTQELAQSDMDFALDLPPQEHQIGGLPAIQNPQTVKCPICSKLSPLLAVICDDATGNQPGEVPASQSFTDNEGTQMVFHFCRDCSVMSAYHSND
ncbi:MAG: hypothetical protein ABJF23_03250 [Bryobacteraceae bacterium]